MAPKARPPAQQPADVLQRQAEPQHPVDVGGVDLHLSRGQIRVDCLMGCDGWSGVDEGGVDEGEGGVDGGGVGHATTTKDQGT